MRNCAHLRELMELIGRLTAHRELRDVSALESIMCALLGLVLCVSLMFWTSSSAYARGAYRRAVCPFQFHDGDAEAGTGGRTSSLPTVCRQSVLHPAIRSLRA